MRRWAPLGLLVLLEIGYPLVSGRPRAVLVALTVIVGFSAVLVNAGSKATVVIITAGGFAVEALGVATGFPFGAYSYSGALGPRLLGVPLVIPLAWTWMAYPAWRAAARLTTAPPEARPSDASAGSGVTATAPPQARPSDASARSGVTPANRVARVLLAAVGLAAWDLFLDPQMVAERYWTWRDPSPALPGVPDVPISNYLGWLGVAIVLMAVVAGLDRPARNHDAPLLALYLWTYASSILAHAVFLGLPASAGWGALGMGVVALPLAWRLVRSRTRVPA
jgi:putative membrane protein